MRHFKKNSGFTLTEIVSVIGLVLLITVMIYNLLNISQQSFTVGDRRMEVVQNARIFLDRLTRELRQTPEIATPLPATKSEVGFPPASEILFQDGHGLTDIQYLKYYLDGNLLRRQRIVYHFPSESDVYVHWNARDEFGTSPESEVLEERTIAEYISQLKFYGTSVTYIEVWVTKGGTDTHLLTGVWGRNTRL